MLNKLCSDAKIASRDVAKLATQTKNNALLEIANELISSTEQIISANEIDIKNAIANNMSPALLDRLKLNEDRIIAMAEGMRQIASLDDPIGEVTSMKKVLNGLTIGQQRVPIGVIGIIYESRPNVTIDAFSLCFKAGNAVILRGGSDCINSNIALVKVVKEALSKLYITKNAISLIENTDRAIVNKFMKMNQYVDLLIPRGGAGLIQNVIMNATIPVIETGTGNCHIYIDKFADINMALPIIKNAKFQRLGVCNACESVVIHSDIFDEAIGQITDMLKENGCEIRGDERVVAKVNDITLATEEDFATEYLDKIISIKVVNSLDDAIDHINKYSTKHSEAIITNDYESSQRFLNEIDSACVYINASTRFSDGFEFGFGAEIGISTQKLHARGPMGLLALTSTKYIIYGNGQFRE